MIPLGPIAMQLVVDRHCSAIDTKPLGSGELVQVLPASAVVNAVPPDVIATHEVALVQASPEPKNELGSPGPGCDVHVCPPSVVSRNTELPTVPAAPATTVGAPLDSMPRI